MRKHERTYTEKWNPQNGPFIGFYLNLETVGNQFTKRSVSPEEENRIEKFSKEKSKQKNTEKKRIPIPD